MILGKTLLSIFLVVLSSNAAFAKAQLRDIYGANHYFDEFADPNTKAVVFVVLDEFCPVVQLQTETLRKLHAKYNSYKRDRAGLPTEFDKYPGDKVVFIGLLTTPDLGSKDLGRIATKLRLPFRFLWDRKQEFVNQFGLTRYSEAIVFDRHWKQRYRGPVDNQYNTGSRKPAPTQNYVSDAVDALVADQPFDAVERPAAGCLINRAQPVTNAALTYSKDIAPIIQSRCTKCHRTGEVGPMPFTNFEEVNSYAEMIEEVVMDKRMPPWPAVSHNLKSTEELSAKERETLLSWLRLPDAERKEGDPKDLPPMPQWHNPKEWKIGTPDLIFKMPKPFKVPASGWLDYVYIPILINGGKGTDQDLWIEAIETRAGAPEVVHHIQVQEFQGQLSSEAGISPLEQLMHYGLSVENARLVGSYTPGNLFENAREYKNWIPDAQGKPTTAAMKLKKGSNLMLEMHYTPNGKEVFDQSEVGIRFAKTPPKVEVQTWFPFRKRLDMVIPANIGHHTLQDFYHFGRFTGGKAVVLHGVRPHLHSRGKSFRLELVDARNMSTKSLEDFDSHDRNKGQVLLDLPVWDFNWQHLYRFEKPIVVRPDQGLLVTGAWDNARYNPRNPNADENVVWGQQTQQEMFNTLLLYEVLDAGDPRLKQLEAK